MKFAIVITLLVSASGSVSAMYTNQGLGTQGLGTYCKSSNGGIYNEVKIEGVASALACATTCSSSNYLNDHQVGFSYRALDGLCWCQYEDNWGPQGNTEVGLTYTGPGSGPVGIPVFEQQYTVCHTRNAFPGNPSPPDTASPSKTPTGTVSLLSFIPRSVVLTLLYFDNTQPTASPSKTPTDTVSLLVSIRSFSFIPRNVVLTLLYFDNTQPTASPSKTPSASPTNAVSFRSIIWPIGHLALKLSSVFL